VVKPAAFVAAVLLAGQASDARVGQFGRVGRALAEAEIAQITRLANELGKSPRLVLGVPSMVGGLASISVYLDPDAAGSEVQRGRMLRLEADVPPKVTERSAWRLKETHSYACIAVPGRRHFEVDSDRDTGWPFIVDGQLDDETLMSIVAFIRTRPRIPGRSDSVHPLAVADAPISGITRRNNEVIVTLRTGEATGERVSLVRRGPQWVITHHGMWIV
jgi:hypothetical protein